MYKPPIDDVLKIIRPNNSSGNSCDNTLPLIFDSPHSGRVYPESFNHSCDPQNLIKAEDRFVDDLFSAAPDHGATLLCAQFPRTYIDVNRAADDIDEALYEEDWPYEAEMPVQPSNRSYAGIGLIRRLIKPNTPLYNYKLSPKDIKSRIETYYHPYHEALEGLIEDAHAKHGKVWHINCHSMPSPSLTAGTLGRINPFSAPDFVLGDRDGTSCDIDLTHALRDFIKSLGYKVAINDPYKGVELVERHSDPARGKHSIQIEIARALYLNEDTYEKSKNYEKLKGDIEKLIKFCADYVKNNAIK